MSDRNSHFPSFADPALDLDAQAAEWLVAREGGAWSGAQEQAWQRWCQASAAHRAAYAHAERTWGELAGFRTAPELLDAASVPARTGTGERSVRALPRAWRWGSAAHRAAWAGLAAVFMATALLLGWSGGDPLVALQADHRTGVGELREVILADGSRVQLGADSAIAVHFSATERRLELLKGEALFEAEPVRAQAPGGERRPFVVVAAQGHTRALGTRFVVERFATHTLVTGVEHQVAVALGENPAPGTAPPGRRAVLSPGQAVRYDASGLGTVQSASTEQATAWRRSVLVFDHARLTDVVARLGRYQGGRIVVWGDALGQRLVSGVFPIGDTRGSLQSIVDELDATALSLPGITVLY